MTEVYGAIVGSTCVMLGVITNRHEYWDDTHTGWTVCYDKVGDEEGAVSINSGDSPYMVTFRENCAWEVDIRDLEQNTTYNAWVIVNGETSNTISFTTETLGVYRNSVTWKNGENSSSYTSKDRSSINGALSTLSGTFISVGFNIDQYINGHKHCFKIYPDDDSEFAGSAAAHCHGINGPICIEAGHYNNVNEMTKVMMHESLHYFFFSRQSGEDNVTYVSDIMSQRGYSSSAIDNFHQVLSFFSFNNNKTEAYMFYGENSVANLMMSPPRLFIYFLIKAITNNPVTIINNRPYEQ